ncbi:hypothetical protein CVIRNUC_009336 [Coccomyxa viridis]|uniref:Tr-type G domain-containing protein n=1 Tax=Coccomyxa viridis TaxID=1274662 RepID=A0AAV1IFL7_9CHLO|nr:hypothetical protein CVIRNUC_009336 [Coccomyxa viridis]
MNVTTQELVQLQSKTERIRNICILAHVDHGKTTMSDHLIASNGLIHPRLVGELRYLDSRDDEQARGITMKSSSICLLHIPGIGFQPSEVRTATAEERLSRGHLVNLIDSPGHVDFCSEVSTAARLSDGALVVVDAVEGVCIQTHAVLRQAWQEKVRLCLVINKMDRLILELGLSPQEAYLRLRGIITHVNMIVSAFQSEQHISDADAVLAHEDAKATLDNRAAQEAMEDAEDEELELSPEKGNVAFASAHDGWAFRTSQFAELYAAKLGFKAATLGRVLWGDYRIDPKTRNICRIRAAHADKHKPLFVQLALEPIWKAYEACGPGAEAKTILGKVVKGLGLQHVSDKALAQADPKAALRAVMKSWLPLSEAVLGMAVEQLPDPASAAPERLPRLLALDAMDALDSSLSASAQQELEACQKAASACSTDPGAPLVAYVSKMVAVPASALPRVPGEPGPRDPSQEVFLAFSRIFSGVIRDGQTVQVLSAAYSPARPEQDRLEVQVKGLYLMMGRGLERLSDVPAGCVLAIGGLERCILKSATLSSTPACRPLAPMLFQASPIVRVAVEPARPTEMAQLEEGLRLLNQADPFVEVSMQDSGEHVIGAAGEVHLETIIKDLRERFACVDLRVSPPLVAFRESVYIEEEAPEPQHKPAKVVEATTANGLCTVRVRALPLPAQLASILDNHKDLLSRSFASEHDEPRTSSPAAADCGNADPEHGSSTNGCHDSLAGPQPDGAYTDSTGALDSNGHSSAAADSQRSEHAQAEDLALSSLSLLSNTAANSEASAGRRDQGSHPESQQAEQQHSSSAPEGSRGVAAQHRKSADIGQLRARLRAAAQDAGAGVDDLFRRAWMLGPHRAGPNLLLCPDARSGGLWGTPGSSTLQLGKRTAGAQSSLEVQEDASESISEQADVEIIDVALREHLAASVLGFAAAGGSDASQAARWDGQGVPPHVLHSIQSGLATGFQLAAAAGPLCDEPMWGIAFEVAVRVNVPAAGISLAEDVYGPFSGQVTSAVRQAMRRAVLEAHVRLVEAMFLCEVSSTAEVLSGTYAVLGKRRSRVVREELREGSGLFSILAFMPAQASFGLADDLRRRTSGGASAALMLSHWERLQVDPFFVPVTEEEREEFGEEGQGVGTANLARTLLDEVRRRKGLAVDRKVVESATKQRTRARKV